MFFLEYAAADNKKMPVEVEIKSHDGFKLRGVLNIPDKASITSKAPLVIFLHSICKNKTAWEELPDNINESLNVATLNLDIRGHGKSTKDKEDKRLHWQNLKAVDYKKMPDDVLEVLKFIKKEYPEIDDNKVAIVGAGLGSVMGLMAASYVSDNIDAIIMFSPMLSYKGFDLRLPIVNYGEKPVLVFASEKDKYSFESGKELMKFAQGKKHFETYSFGGNGEDLLKFQPNSGEFAVKWLKENFTEGKAVEYKNKPAISDFKRREVGEYFGKVKTDRDLYRGVHKR